jgi:hypothetical protein
VAHGAPGQIELGSGIDRAALLAHAAEIGGWGVERIYLWSCRVGADQAFVSLLEELSGARVIASAEALAVANKSSPTRQTQKKCCNSVLSHWNPPPSLTKRKKPIFDQFPAICLFPNRASLLESGSQSAMPPPRIAFCQHYAPQRLR